jgi:WD40 repeat protein
MKIIHCLIIFFIVISSLSAFEQTLQIGGKNLHFDVHPTNDDIYITRNQCLCVFDPIDGSQKNVFPLRDFRPNFFSFNHSGDKIAVINNDMFDYQILILKLDGDTVSIINPVDQPQILIRFDSDENLLIKHITNISKYDINSGEKIDSVYFEHGWYFNNISANGEYLSSTNNSIIKIKNAKTLDSITFDTDNRNIVQSFMNYDASMVAVYGHDSTFKVFSVKDSSLVYSCDVPFEIKYGVSYVCFSSDNKQLAYCTAKGISIIDLNTKTRKRIREQNYLDSKISFSNDNDYIYIMNNDNFDKIDLRNYECDVLIRCQKDYTPSTDNFVYKFTPDKKKIITAYNELVTYWDVETAKFEKHFIGNSKLRGVKFNHDGSEVISLCKKSLPSPKKWDTKKGTMISYSDELREYPTSVFVSNDSTFYLVSRNENLERYDYDKKEFLFEFEDFSSSYDPYKISRDGTLLYTWHFGRVIGWDMTNGKRIESFESIYIDSTIKSADISTDKSLIICSRQAETVIVDAITGEKIRFFDTWSDLSGFSPDGKLVFTMNDGNNVKVFSYPELDEIYHFDYETAIYNVEFSKDNSFLIVDSYYYIRIYDMNNGKIVKTIDGVYPFQVHNSYDISQDSKKIAYRLNDDIYIESTRGVENLKELSFPNNINPNLLKWFPDGIHYAAVYDIRYLAIINSTTNQIVKEVDLLSEILDIDISDNGKYIVAGCQQSQNDASNGYLWDISKDQGEFLVGISNNPVIKVSFINGGNQVFLSAVYQMGIWNTENRGLVLKGGNLLKIQFLINKNLKTYSLFREVIVRIRSLKLEISQIFHLLIQEA